MPEGQVAVDAVKFEGNDAVSASELEERLATRATSKLLGLVQGVFFEYRLYDHYVLQTDIQRVERIYRSFGYYQARVVHSRVIRVKPNHVKVIIQVEEGAPTLIEQVGIVGLSPLTPNDARPIERKVHETLPQGAVFTEDRFEEAKDEFLFELRNQGYARATIDADTQVDLVRHRARVRLSVKPGVECVYGSVKFRGLKENLPEDLVRRTLGLYPGDPYSQEQLLDAQKAALALGVFSSVQIIPALENESGSNEVPLTVEFEETPLQTFELGAGTQLDVVRAAVHARASWRSLNFMGGLREFRAQVKPGLTFYPTRLQSLQAPTALLPMVETSATLRQPSFIEARTNGFLRGGFEMYPLIISSQIDESAPILGYREFQGSSGLERAFGSHIFLATQYSAVSADPFTYQGELDPDLENLFISSVEAFARFDTRDDLLFPTTGIAFSAGIDFAGLGGDVVDFRVTPELRGYIPLSRHLTLALRVGTGLLFPINWGDSLGASGDGTSDERSSWVRDSQISLYRSYFAGGPNSNRGYGQRGIGPHGVIPFFVPGVQGQDVALECEANPQSNPAQCLLPLGGRTLWTASAELRFPIWHELHGATFCDSADVAPQVFQYRWNRPHLSCGLGARYATPVGPIRFDVAYRIPGLQTIGNDTGEGIPPTLFGLPVVLALSIGEAF